MAEATFSLSLKLATAGGSLAEGRMEHPMFFFIDIWVRLVGSSVDMDALLKAKVSTFRGTATRDRERGYRFDRLLTE